VIHDKHAVRPTDLVLSGFTDVMVNADERDALLQWANGSGVTKANFKKILICHQFVWACLADEHSRRCGTVDGLTRNTCSSSV
jgi:hypothetical protein